MRGHESHIMADGSEHDAGVCPDECTLTNSLGRLLEQLDAGTLEIVRVS